jgi:hypothetical protein
VSRRLWNLALAAVILSTVPSASALAQGRLDSAQINSGDTPLLTTNRVLLASLQRISRGSALWREAIANIRKTRRQALVVTPDESITCDRRKVKDCVTFDSGLLAEVVPVLRADSQIPLVVVVVNLALIQGIHDAQLSVPRDFERDVDRILVHEIYGHAVPYLLAGDLAGRCADPRQGERASEACSIRRENAVRAELGLGRRADYGVFSLALARGRSF